MHAVIRGVAYNSSGLLERTGEGWRLSWGGLGSVELAIYGIYKNREKKRKSVILFFTQLHLVSKKMRVSKIANLVNAPIIHKQKNVVRTY